MERLQTAISKARAKQGQNHTSRTTVNLKAHAQPLGAEQWQELPEIALSKPALLRNRIVAMDATPEATPFDMLRTKTLRTMQENDWRRLAITSPTASCGKSTISLNLAFSVARQSNTRAIGIELDMRQPNQNRLLGVKNPRSNKCSVGDLLTGDAMFGDLAVKLQDKLALVTNDGPVSNASDVLLSETVGQVLDNIEAQYQPEIMIFDMPPLLVNDDAMAFMRYVDCALIIAAAGHSTIDEIDRCERDLASQTNVLGVVLNKCEFSASGYGGYGNYSY